MSTIIFLSVFTTVLGLINLYSYKRFIKKLHLKKSYRDLFKIFIFLIFFGEITYALGYKLDFLPQWMYYTLAIPIGISFMLFTVSLVYDLTHVTIKRVPFNESRRKAIKIFLDISMLVIFVGYILRGFIEGNSKPVIKRVKISIPEIDLKNFKIVHLTDVHIGNVIKKDFIQDLVERVNKLNPDMVVITGDLIDKKIATILEDVEPLKNLQSRYGTHFCYGNHEYFHGAEEIGEHLESLGINVLADEVVTIDNKFNLVGLKDLITARFDLPHDFKKPFKEINNNLGTIVLSHQPRQITEFEEFSPELILSGHTHGGQIFPFSFLVSLAQPYLAGLYQHNKKTQIYVSRGTGFWGPPIRVFAPAEIAELIIN